MDATIILITACIIIVVYLIIMIYVRMVYTKLNKKVRITKACSTFYALRAQGVPEQLALRHAMNSNGIHVNNKEDMDALTEECAIYELKALKYKQSFEFTSSCGMIERLMHQWDEHPQ